jgi:hypothetical protein
VQGGWRERMRQSTAQKIKEKVYANKKKLFFLLIVVMYLCSPLFYYGVPRKLNFVRTSPSGKYIVETYMPDHCCPAKGEEKCSKSPKVVL